MKSPVTRTKVSGLRGAGGARSQALLGQRGGHLVGQRGQLRGVGHVDAAGGRHGAEVLRGLVQGHDLGAVVGAGPGCLTEAQLVALNLQPDQRNRLLLIFHLLFRTNGVQRGLKSNILL